MKEEKDHLQSEVHSLSLALQATLQTHVEPLPERTPTRDYPEDLAPGEDDPRRVQVAVERIVQDRVIIPFGVDQGAEAPMPLRVYLDDAFLTEAILEKAGPHSSIARLHSGADSIKIGQILTLILD